MKTGKKKIFQKIKLMVPLALMSVTLGACSLTSQSSTSASASATTTQTATSTTKTDTSSYFTDRDQDASYDESTATKISLNGSTAKTSGDGARVSG